MIAFVLTDILCAYKIIDFVFMYIYFKLRFVPFNSISTIYCHEYLKTLTTHIYVVVYHFFLSQSFVFCIVLHLIMHSFSEQIFTEILNNITQVGERKFLGFVKIKSVHVTRPTLPWVVPWKFGLVF